MTYLICNIFVSNSTSIESFLDHKVMKELAFNSKIKTQLPGKGKDLKYNALLIPILEKPKDISNEMILLQQGLFEKTTSVITLTEDMMYSIAVLFNEGNRMVLTSEKLFLDISVLGKITDTEFDIIYSDGSFKKSTNEASYGVAKLLKEDNRGLLDMFTERLYTYQEISGKVQDGTNNIGELNGLKHAVKNFSDKKYQIIISDSEYSIKVFREWYYTWKNNDFKTHAKKEIKNKELIQEIYKLAEDSNTIILFKWTKGHAKNPFNELCDELAKKALK